MSEQQPQISAGSSLSEPESSQPRKEGFSGEETKPKAASSKMIPGSNKPSKRGRKPCKIDVKAKLERSRQSARECRARKKLRYQYLEELVASRERAIYTLRHELESFKKHCKQVDDGKVPKEVADMIKQRDLRRERGEQEGLDIKEEPMAEGYEDEEYSDDDEDDGDGGSPTPSQSQSTTD